MRYRVVLVALLAFTATTVIRARWNAHKLQESIAARQKVEALTDAVNNGLITRQRYESKVRELVGQVANVKALGVSHVAYSTDEIRIATDSEQIAGLSEALAHGSITREKFDAKLAEFAQRRQMEAELPSDRPRVVGLIPVRRDPLSVNR